MPLSAACAILRSFYPVRPKPHYRLSYWPESPVPWALYRSGVMLPILAKTSEEAIRFAQNSSWNPARTA